MARSFTKARGIAVALGTLATFAVVSCSGDRGTDVGRNAADAVDASTGTTALDIAKSATPRSIVQQGARVEVSRAESSQPFATATPEPSEDEREEHEPLRVPHTRGAGPMRPSLDAVLQSTVPILSMPATILNFSGQADSSFVSPPDTNGAVGLNHFVQTVNLNIEMWNKNGTVAAASKATRALWAGYVGTNAGNRCSTRNDGDPVVVYDQIADRWFITQFSLPGAGTVGGPSYQCIAVSKTSDPTGAYSLYDFKYNYSIDDYGKFSVWPDGYYATFNMFDSAGGGSYTFKGADFCAYDRTAMLAGLPATQQCFFQPNPVPTPPPTCTGVQPFVAAGALPLNFDGKVNPPVGSPGYFVQFDYSQCGPTYNQLDFWALHLDWTTPASSTLTGPTAVTVADFTPTCFTTVNPPPAGCVPEPGGGVLAGLDDRVMFRFNYRNFGSHQSLLLNHSVTTGGAGARGGVRWYEVRLPGGTPTLFQQGTYAPNDTNWRWMASIAQDQAQDIALGYSLTSATKNPSIAWTGRVATDPVNTMGQAEAIIDNGTGASGGGRWGDYSNMTVDPVDDCTFWYTQMQYGLDWVTFIATVKFPNCAANDFTIALAPATQSLPQGGSVPYTVTTTRKTGVAETIALYVQDLPSGVTGTFNPTTVTAGSPSTLTLTATAAAPPTATPVTFTVIGKTPSAVHAATASVSVTGCVKLTQCPAGDNCGTISDNCGGTVICGGACQALDQCHNAGTCTNNVCTNPAKGDGTACTGANKCLTYTCQAGACTGANPVVCTASDQCHNAGTCDSTTGACSNPAKTDGTACTGANKCNQVYACQAGTCTGANPVVCSPQDECHVAGTCDTSTGGCSNPPKANGTPCSIGTCQSGTCTPQPDAGAPDSGTPDSGAPDAGTDSGIPDTDSGTPDSGGPDSGIADSGTHRDASPPRDSGSGVDGSSPDAGDQGTGNNGGCGCRTAEPKSESPVGLAFAGGLGLIGVLRLRRRKR